MKRIFLYLVNKKTEFIPSSEIKGELNPENNMA